MGGEKGGVGGGGESGKKNWPRNCGVKKKRVFFFLRLPSRFFTSFFCYIRKKKENLNSDLSFFFPPLLLLGCLVGWVVDKENL